MKLKLSYTICFTQRTGSTLLWQGLGGTGIADIPNGGLMVEGNIVPSNVVYEDFIQEYEKTVRKVLEFLELDTIDVKIPSPSLVPTADDISEERTGRFRDELQKGWVNWGS